MRRSIIWVSTGQYVNLALGFLSTLFLVRLLTPAEYGISALGWAILGIAEALREFSSGTFLVRERELSAGKIRTSVTINVLITLIVIAGLMHERTDRRKTDLVILLTPTLVRPSGPR